MDIRPMYKLTVGKLIEYLQQWDRGAQIELVAEDDIDCHEDDIRLVLPLYRRHIICELGVSNEL